MVHAVAPTASRLTLAVTAADESAVAAAVRRARELQIPFIAPGAESDAPLLLVQTSSHLELHDRRRNETVRVQIKRTDMATRRVNRRDPLARALGRADVVIDATAGLGGDTLLMLCLGYGVIAFERNAVVAALLHDGVRRGIDDGLIDAARVHVVNADARMRLPELAPPPEVIYLDPMFPPKRKKSAAVRKELRLLRELTGADDDAGELLAVSRQCARRVVVKRPIDAPALAPDFTASYRGRLVRYDAYAGRAD